jgi:hypothetical protein
MGSYCRTALMMRGAIVARLLMSAPRLLTVAVRRRKLLSYISHEVMLVLSSQEEVPRFVT